MTTPFAGLEWLSAAVLMLDDQLHVTYANPAAETLLAHGRKHLIGVPFDKALPGNAAFEERLRQALEAESGFNDNDLLLEVVGYPIHLHGVITPVDAGEGRLLLEFRELEQQLKIAREERLFEQQQANRELVRNLAHEIKNPLGGIRGAAQLLEGELSDPELREFTQVIVKEADRLQSLMNRLLTPSKLPQIEAINIHELLERVRTLLTAEFPDAPEIRRDYDTSLPDLVGDKESLIQAILNVARNAAQATAGRGAIRFETRIARQLTIARKRHRLVVALTIEDDGPGVPPEIAELIFYPMVSGRDGGTGLGLSLAQSFVSRHQGMIEFESAPGRTRFTILLPIRERETAMAEFR
ncbi:nitrogen regulation protein NR(II) [Usitatibacter palustris]|uniref:Sensory histidine kinase/phosphatase NtrB n=1 Tax=Usitatibacter palustris TaxID=2732487 RepID=A0A6M4HB04_9PROT|nr:nitrogen regulation protein NR(II) [Usitatibacter palustris]QJR16870.1 Sensory histidine kinase/phosphatase NtrB [Usitatibacter palustris]